MKFHAFETGQRIGGIWSKIVYDVSHRLNKLDLFLVFFTEGIFLDLSKAYDLASKTKFPT